MDTNATFLTLVLATFFWGANFNVGKFAVAHASPLHVAAWRFFIAALCMVVVYIVKEKRPNWASIRQNLVTYVAMGLVGIFGFNALFFFGLQSTSALNGSLIMALNPSLSVVMAALALRQRIQGRQILGLLVSLIGVLVVVTNASFARLLTLELSQGDLLIFIGSVCWAAYAVIAKKFVKSGTNLQTTTISMVAGAGFLGLLALLEPAKSVAPADIPTVAAAVLFMAVFGSVLAYLWWNGAIAKLGAARTAVFFDLVPIFTMVISVCRGEAVTVMQFAGSILVIVGVLFSSGFDFAPLKRALGLNKSSPRGKAA